MFSSKLQFGRKNVCRDVPRMLRLERCRSACVSRRSEKMKTTKGISRFDRRSCSRDLDQRSLPMRTFHPPTGQSASLFGTTACIVRMSALTRFSAAESFFIEAAARDLRHCSTLSSLDTSSFYRLLQCSVSDASTRLQVAFVRGILLIAAQTRL